MADLVGASASPGRGSGMRALEVTVIAHGDVVPWRHPARRELQFGEWLRRVTEAGIVEPPRVDRDLAILLTKTRQHGVALVARPANVLFEPVPARDFVAALLAIVAQWQAEPGWRGDACSVVHALARIWYSAATGGIAPKDVAATSGAGALAGRAPAGCSGCACCLSRWRSARGDPAGEPLAEFIDYARRTVESMPSRWHRRRRCTLTV
ncbi:aminoglycoside adenylyltransferase family protein [Burkholderia sp. MSMB1835]|uniref:aminoglycoside adenylyltransferase family protein n=1 Tax=Burkholderia sp. MSMB1835 TaxID=1637876 RepID=UPI000A6A72CA|nr:aminoglycoside adenylyltransferase family protein [Burkholderia sp. MSMB1835]